MESLLKGRLRNTPLPYSRSLTPVFEAVVNSIQAIEDQAAARGNSCGEYRIEVHMVRSDVDELGLPETGGIKAPIVGFEITDNGIGFTKENWESFGLLDNISKADRGCRGIGRLTWLKASEKVEVDSVYHEDGEVRRRSFTFDPESSISLKADDSVNSTTRQLTVVRLKNLRTNYAKTIPKSADKIAVEILEHCLWYFVRDFGVPKIFVIDGDEQVDLDDLFDQHMHSSSEVEEFEIKSQSFEVTHVKFRASAQKRHQLNFCAAGRVVRSDSLRDKVVGLRSALADDDGLFTYSGYLTGKFLNERDTGQRNAFNIDDTTPELIADSEISFEDIWAEILPRIGEFLKEPLENNIAAARERVHTFVSSEAPRYKPILKHIPAEDLAVDPCISDAKLDEHLNKQMFKVEQRIRGEGREILGLKDAENPEVYLERVQDYMQSVSDLKKSDLADYMMHRRTIIDLLEKAIQKDDDGKFSREDMIHQLIVPMRTTSEDIEYSANNLWLVDERLAFHDYLASDKPLKSYPTTDSVSSDRPDIAVSQVFNNPLAVSENVIGEHASITVVEIKRPMRSGYSNAIDDPIEQALSYLRKLRQGAATKSGRPIPNAASIPGFIYVLADLTTSLTERCKFHQLTPTSDALGYFGYHSGEGYKAYIQVISFDGLIKSAKERHRMFFDKLGLPAG